MVSSMSWAKVVNLPLAAAFAGVLLSPSRINGLTLKLPEVNVAHDEPYQPTHGGRIWEKYPEKLIYLRNPKAGSTSFKDMILEAQKTNAQCNNVFVFFHDALARDIPVNVSTFTILRDPCERFLSQHSHLWQHIVDIKRTTFLEGEVNHERIVRALENPLTWAEALLHDETLKGQFLDRDPVNFWKTNQHSMIAWPQAFYANENTQFACLPTMRKDVQKILEDNPNTRGCVLPDSIEANEERHRKKPWTLTDDMKQQVCKLTKKIYTDDEQLWERHCGR